MKHVFRRKAPLIHVALAIAAVLITSFIGAFIDFLATENVAVIADLLHGPVLIAKQK